MNDSQTQTYVFRMTEDQYATLVDRISEAIKRAVDDTDNGISSLDEAARLIDLAKVLFNPA